MIKLTVKIIIGGITILSFMLFLACSKDKSTGPENDSDKHPAELVGTWQALTENYNIFITTNSVQKVADMISPGNGTISITGDQQTELKYMFFGEEGSLRIWVSNVPIIDIEEMNYPAYFLIFQKDPDPTVIFMAMLSETEDLSYMGTVTDLDYYEPETFTLTVTGLQLNAVNSSGSILVNGTLSNSMIEVQANTPTCIYSLENQDAMGSVNLSADGTFTRTSVDDSETEITTGTWEVIDSENLTIIETSEDEFNHTVKDTITSTFMINSSGILTIIVEGNACDTFDYDENEDLNNIQDCINKFEEDYFLEEGSVISLTVQMSFTYSRSVAKF